MNTYRCEGVLGWVDHPRCENAARIEIDGHKYCHLHASQLALSKFKSNDQPNSTRCECTCKYQTWWKRGEKELRESEGWRCKINASLKIDGINMCRSHAKLIILQHLIKDGLAKVLPYNGPYKPMCYV